MTRAEDAILAVPMGNAGIRIKDIHRQKGLTSQSPRRARVLEQEICRVSRYRFLRPDRRIGRPGQTQVGEGVGACPVICRLIIVETGSQKPFFSLPRR